MKSVHCPTCGQLRPDVLAEHLSAALRLAEDRKKPDGLLTYLQAAEMLAVGETTIRGLVASGHLPTVPIPDTRSMRISHSAISDFIRQAEARSVRWQDDEVAAAMFAPGKTRGRQLKKATGRSA